MSQHPSADPGIRDTGEPGRDYRPWPDCQALQATMAGVLRFRLEGWDSIDPADIRVEQVGRTGGGRVFKLSNQARPRSAAAALHVLGDRFSGPFRDLFVGRPRSAQRAFVEADLAMERLAEDPGQQWFVEAWGGDVIHDQELCVPVVEKIGHCLARAHAIDPAWFDASRQRLTELYPVLTEAGDGGWLWAWVWHYGLEQMDEATQRRHAVIGPVPASEVGAGLVTSHLDPSGENIVRGPDRWRFIDLVSASVNYAALDIACFFSKATATDRPSRKPWFAATCRSSDGTRRKLKCSPCASMPNGCSLIRSVPASPIPPTRWQVASSRSRIGPSSIRISRATS